MTENVIIIGAGSTPCPAVTSRLSSAKASPSPPGRPPSPQTASSSPFSRNWGWLKTQICPHRPPAELGRARCSLTQCAAGLPQPESLLSHRTAGSGALLSLGRTRWRRFSPTSRKRHDVHTHYFRDSALRHMLDELAYPVMAGQNTLGMACQQL